MKTLLNLFIVFAIGLVLGGASAYVSIRQAHGVGAINVGSWSAWPFVGGVEIDPYTSARGTANGTLPLGAAEGLAFEAALDSNNAPLERSCRYRLSGETPTARVWTLSAYDPAGRLASGNDTQVPALHSGNLIRFDDGSFKIEIGNIPVSGNWIPVSGAGNFRLILRLYDTPITSNSGLIAPEMPLIEKLECG